MLNLEKAVELYILLEPYLPKAEEINSLQYVDYIVNGMLDNEKGAKKYLKSVMIMHDFTMEDLTKKSSEEVLSLFINGLIENKFVSLATFLGSLKYGK